MSVHMPTWKHNAPHHAYQLCCVYLFAQHFELALSLIDATLVLLNLKEYILFVLI